MLEGQDLVPAKSPYVIGIDLGTTNTSASIYRKGASDTLKVEGEYLSLPSVVRFVKKEKSDVQVGRAAKQYILINPEEVFSSIKSIMRNEDWEKNTDLKQKFNIGGEQLSPTDIAAEILKKLLEDVQTYNDTEGDIERAVICVPANTTDEYRLNVFEAAKKAGLGLKDDNGDLLLDADGHPQGVFILEEPTAAAISYGEKLGILNKERDQHIMVYDLGGGTFDVTILHIDSTNEDEPAKFTVKGTSGIAKLGGDDFDHIIMEICAQNFQEESKINVFDPSADNKGTTGKEIKTAQQKLKEEAERAKIEMAGGVPKVEIGIIDFLKDGDGEKYNLEVEVTKKDFLEKAAPLLEETVKCVNDVLSEAKMTIDDINRIILVGGSTKADWITKIIKEKLGKEPFRADNVDVIVSQGAAVYGANLPTAGDGQTDQEPMIEIEGITSHHLGIELQGQKFGLVIPKGLPLNSETPVQKVTKVFGNPHNSDTVMITIWKTQKNIAFDESNDPLQASYVSEQNDQGNRLFECVGEFSLKGIPPAPEGKEKIEVTMEIDQNNLLKVSAKLLSSGLQEEVQLNVTKK